MGGSQEEPEASDKEEDKTVCFLKSGCGDLVEFWSYMLNLESIRYTLGGGLLSGLPEGQSSLVHTCIASFVDRAQLWACDIP